MPLTQRGLVYKIGQTESRQYQDKTFVSRILILEQPSFDQYTGEKKNSNYIKFEATKEETCAALGKFAEGQKVEVEFIVRGSKYTKKDNTGEDVFTHLEIRQISLVAASASATAPVGAQPLPGAAPAPAPAPVAAAPAAAAPAGQGDYDPDLGF